MKKILLFAGFALTLVAASFAQNMILTDHVGSVTNGDTITAVGDTGYYNVISDSVWCRNNTSSPLIIKVRKKELSVVTGSTNYFCWVQCYSSTIFVSDPDTLQPGDNPFCSGDYKPKGHVGISYIQYTFFNVANPSDTICVVVKFDASLSAVSEKSADGNIEYFNAYPNPATDQVLVSYSVSLPSPEQYSLVIRDLVGKVVYSIGLNEKSGLLRIPSGEMNSGLYFYSLVGSGRSLASKKLIIRH